MNAICARVCSQHPTRNVADDAYPMLSRDPDLPFLRILLTKAHSLFRVCFDLPTCAHIYVYMSFAPTHPPPPAMAILAAPLRYADIYTSRVSNLIRYSPFMYFRSPSQTLAHDKNN